MEKLSGLILDVYDDPRAEILKSLFPDLAQVPALVKQANLLTLDQRQRLPDDVFALVLQDGDVTLRKFACTDPGNTLLSMFYLTKTAQKLPLIAVERAVDNLKIAAHWYWDTVEELEKDAGIGGAVLGGLSRLGGWAAKNPMKAVSGAMTALGGLSAAKQIGNNLRNVGAREAASGGFGTIVP